MEYLVILFLIIILITLFNFKNYITEKFDFIERRLDKLNETLNKKNTELPKAIIQPVEEKPTVAPPQSSNYWESNFKVVEEEEQPIVTTKPIEQVAKPKVEEEIITEQASVKPSFKELLLEHSTQKIYTPPTPKPSFFERNPDLEKFIGENLISKIGIGILVLAIAFFVKYAIDNDWIGPVGRVGVGILCGAILIGLAHKLRNGYKAFSSVLVGGGLAVFYFTITLAHQKFHLFGSTPTTAFIIMIVITAFAVAISLLYDRQELAIISLIGGFASPFMVSDGSGHYQTLFIYLIILNTGLLIMAYNKAWRLLNLLAFIFTVIIFAGWLLTLVDTDTNQQHTMYGNGFMYATIFYLLFFAINIANNIKENKKFIALDFGILLANTALYFGAGLYCLLNMHAEQYKGLFSAGMGIFNLTASYFLFRNRKIDTNILYLLIGITLTFISLTAPLQLHGNYITLFWASEAVLLCWLYQKSKIHIIQLSSLIVWVAMLVSLLMDWNNVYSNGSLFVNIVFNKGFITTLYAAAASYLQYLLVKKQAIDVSYKSWLPVHVFQLASLILLFAAGALEINFQFRHYYPFIAFNLMYLLLYTSIFVWLFINLTNKIKSLYIKDDFQLLLLCGCIVFYFLSLPITYSIQETILVKQLYSLHFIAHWITNLFMAMIIYKVIVMLKNKKETLNASGIFTWLCAAVIVAFLSIEMHLLVNTGFFSAANSLETLQRVYIKTGLPILWGLCSFAFMWLGMKYKYRPLRIISLTLFSITLFKLFLFDISNIPIAGKIAAFFCLGVILLVVSFMYQRLKKIITDDEEKKNIV